MTAINRRTVTKGIAWSVPAIAVAGAAPAFAASGPKPTVTYKGACKFPGNNCGGRVFQGYGLLFDVKNNDEEEAVYFCSPELTNIVPANTFGGKTPQWTPPAGGSGCVRVAAGETGQLYFFITETGNSQQTNFTADMTIGWGHTCPCSNDAHKHPRIPLKVTVTNTPPHGACQCDSDYIPAGQRIMEAKLLVPAADLSAEDIAEENTDIAKEDVGAEEASAEQPVVEEAPAEQPVVEEAPVEEVVVEADLVEEPTE